MRHKDDALMEQIRQFATDYYLQNATMPSTSEIGKSLGYCKSTIYKYLVEMDRRGMITYQDGTITTTVSDSMSASSLSPVYNEAVSCGPMECVEATVDEYVMLPQSIFGSGNLYVIRTTGDSMIGAGIEAGDLVVVRKQETAREGDIVVARTEEGNTLKRLWFDVNKDRYVLHPENPALEDIVVDEFVIQGVVSHIIKETHK